MKRTTATLVFLLSILETSATQTRYVQGYPNEIYQRRQKRSLLSVWRSILKDTQLISKSPQLRLYYKSGGLQKALEDYNSLKPTVVRNNGILDKVGRVGNVRIVLTQAEGFPALSIPGKSFDNKYRIDRLIVYTERTTPYRHRLN